MDIDTLVSAEWIIPVEPRGTVLAGHAIAIDAGRILELLPAAQAAARYRPRAHVDLPGHALIPGLVNAHTHAAMTLLRGYADDLPLERWLSDYIWPAERAHAGAGFVRDGARLACAEMLAGGVTCCNDMYFFPGETAAAAIETGMRAVVGLIVIGFPNPWAGDIDDHFEKGLAAHDLLRHEPLVTTCFAPHAPHTVPEAALLRVARLAEELDLPITMHVHETAAEVRDAVARDGIRPLQRLEGLGLLSPRLLAVHATQLGDGDIDRLARYGVTVVHCPESNLKLASGMCPVARLLAAGVNVALGTDGAASNNDLDMLGEMRTAALLAKGVAGDPTALPAPDALAMATLAGARALGMESRVGSLVPGKEADLVAVRLDGFAHQPVWDPLSHLVYATSRSDVARVWVAGRPVVVDGVPLRIDRAALARRAADWRGAIAAGRTGS